MTIRLDDRVAIVTGAGGGLGRTHALLLAERGAKVVVNDLGGGLDGTGGGSGAADAVVAEILQAGGVAVASHASVATADGARSIADTALEAFGRIDVLINNAGILRDKSFAKVKLDDFRTVLDVHLGGTVNCTHAVWPVMRAAGYGRIVMTTSIAGTSGNFGQSAYGSAKLGIIGLVNTLAIEGRRDGIFVNAVSPGAATRMTGGLNAPAIDRYLLAEHVSPVVAYLASEDCQSSGEVIQAQAGSFSRVHYFETDGVQYDPVDPITPEMVATDFERISDLTTATPTTAGVVGRIEQRLRSVGRWEE